MMWIVAGGVIGGLLGEGIGREFWVWGLIVGMLAGQGQWLRMRNASQAEFNALRAEVDALRRRVDARPLDPIEQRAAEEESAASSVADDVHELPTPVPAPESAATGADTERPAGRRLTDDMLGHSQQSVRDEMGARPTEALNREMLASAPSPRGALPVSAQPNIFAQAWAWLFGGNAVVRIGVVVLFFGVAFLLKYAYDRVQVSIEVRLIGVAIGAIIMLVVGWRLRERRRDYALVMQGGAIGILFLTVFGAFRLWALIDAGPAFAILVILAGLAAMLAILQDALILAVIGTAGGFLAPILASTGKGSHVMLFSYYAVLNSGIAVVALFKAWRALNVMGFVFTFVIALLWADRYYRPEHFATTEPFLVFHFVLFLVVTLLFARQRASRAAAYVDGTLVFGVPIVGFAMQWGLVRDTEYGIAFSAIALGAIYLVLGWVLLRRAQDRYRMLVEAFLALGIIFGTLAIPLALTGEWTVAAWALEGAGLVWVGLRQSHLISRIFGLLVQLAAILAFAVHADRMLDGPYSPADTLSMTLLAAALLFTSRQYAKRSGTTGTPEAIVAPICFTVGALFWLACGGHFLDHHLHRAESLHAFLAFAAASAVIANMVGVRLAWLSPRVASQLFAVIMLFVLVAELDMRHPFAEWGWAAWPVAFAALLWILRREEEVLAGMRPWRHALMFWMLVGLLTWEVSWQLPAAVGMSGDWSLVAWGALPALAILAMSFWGERIRWPIALNCWAYFGVAAPPVVAYLVIWMLVASGESSGHTPPLPYVPIANPVDLAQIAALLAAGAWFVAVKRFDAGYFASLSARHVAAIGGILVFVLLNTLILRTLHHYADVTYGLVAMLRSPLVQATLAIAWTLLALGLMFAGTRKAERAVWIVGAALLGVVVVKLLFLDLARHATVMRIVAFMGVGVLMLVIGYLAPLPARPKEARQ